MAGLAAVAGGAGQGFARQSSIQNEQAIQRDSVNVRREALALQEKMEAAQRQAQLDEMVRTDFQRFLDVAVEGKAAALEEGKNESEIAGLIVPLREQSLASVRLRAQTRPGATPETVDQEIQKFITEFDAKVNSVVSPEVSAASEGRSEVAKERATLESVAGLPPEQQAAINRRLGFTDSGTTDAFFRALDARQRLLDEGKQDTEEFRLVDQRLQSLAQGSSQGLSVDVGPDGRVRVSLGGQPRGGLAGELTGNQLFTQDQRVAEINDKVAILDRLISKTIEDPQDFGLVGSARRTAQTIASGLSDLSSLVSSATGETVDFNAVAGALQEALGIGDVFDPDLSQQQILESELAISLAKLRLSRGGTNVRALSDIFKQAKEDVNLTGFTSSQAVRNRLGEIKSLFESEREAISSGLGGAEEAPVFQDMGDGTFKRIK